MTSLSEQLSAVRQSQWESQLDVFHTLSSRALDSAEQLIALNLKLSRASVEQAAGTLKQLLEAGGPRDLAAFGTVAQDGWQHLFSYSRDLFGIASGARTRSLGSQPAPLALIPAGVPPVFEQMAIATDAAASINSEIAAAAADTGAALAEATVQTGTQEIAKAKEDVVAAFTAAQPAPASASAPAPESAPKRQPTEVTELDAEKAGATPSETPAAVPDSAPAQTSAKGESAVAASATPLGTIFDDAAATATASEEAAPQGKTTLVADAVQQLASRQTGAEHPAAATLPVATSAPVDIPHITPVDSTPPPAVAAAVEPKAPRASRKK